MSRKQIAVLTGLAAMLTLSGAAYGQAQRIPITWLQIPYAVADHGTSWTAGQVEHGRGNTVLWTVSVSTPTQTLDFYCVTVGNSDFRLPDLTGPMDGRYAFYESWDAVNGFSGPLGGATFEGRRELLAPDAILPPIVEVFSGWFGGVYPAWDTPIEVVGDLGGAQLRLEPTTYFWPFPMALIVGTGELIIPGGE